MPLGDFQNSVKKSQRSTKLRTAALNRVRRVILLASCQPLFQASTAQYQARTAQLLTFPSEETQRSGVCIQHSSSLEGFPEDCFLPCLIRCTEGTGIAWMPECCQAQRKVRGGSLQPVLQGGRRGRLPSAVLSFHRTAQGNGICLVPLSGASILWMSGGHRVQESEGTLRLQNSQYQNLALEGARD